MGASHSSDNIDSSPVVFTLYYVPYEPECVDRVREWVMLGPMYKKARFRMVNILDNQQCVLLRNVKYPYVTRMDTSTAPREEVMHDGNISNEAIKLYIDTRLCK